MQLTMEPLDEMLESARVMDRAGMDTIWLAEAYPWWRKHDGGALVDRRLGAHGSRDRAAHDRLGDHLAVHVIRCKLRWMQESCRRRGPGRFLLGFGTSKIFLNNIRSQTSKTLGPMRDAVTIVRGVLGGEPFVRGRYLERRRAGSER